MRRCTTVLPHAYLALAFAAMGCRNDAPSGTVEKPQAPSMQALIDAYAAPTAALQSNAISQLANAVGQRVSTVDSLQVDQRVIDAAYAAIAQLQQQTAASVPALQQPLARDDLAVAAQALTLRGEGYMVVTRICDGWGELPVPDFSNGFMELTVGFTEQDVDSVLWGSITACRYRVGQHQILLDGKSFDPRLGDVRAFIGDNITAANFGTFPNPVLVDLDGQVTVDGVELAGQISFQIDVNTRRLAMLVPIDGGHVIAVVDASRTGVAQVLATNGTFSCDLGALRCTAPDGSQIGAP